MTSELKRDRIHELRRTLIWRACGERIGSFERGPLFWLTSYTKTEDPHRMEKGAEAVAPFPRKPYFPHVLHYILNRSRVFIPKTREMMTSWLVMGYIASEAQWFSPVQWVVQSQKEQKAFELVAYAQQLYRYQEPWMSAKVQVVEDSAGHIKLSNGSEIVGIPAGEGQIRSYHPTGYLMDEASHLPEAMQCYAVALPVARKIIGISSVAPGWFADECGL